MNNQWNEQRYFEDITVGEALAPISIPVTLQRLVSEAGANRDLSLIHHDNAVAQATGAPGAYANTFFMMGMFERLVREWMGIKGKLKKISNLRMKTFNSVGDVMTITGKVEGVDAANSSALVKAAISTDKGVTVTADLTVILPNRS